VLKRSQNDIKSDFRRMAQRHYQIFLNERIVLKALHKINYLPSHFQQNNKKEILI